MAGFLERFKISSKEETNKEHIFYLFSDFQFVPFIQELLTWVNNEKKWKVSILQTTSNPIFQYQTVSKIGKKQTYHLPLIVKNNQLILSTYPTEWMEDYQLAEINNSNDKKNWLADSAQNELYQKIGELIVEQFKISQKSFFIEPVINKFIESTSIQMFCYLYSFIKDSETILALLKASTIKKSLEQIPTDYELHFLLTNERVVLIANQSLFQEVIILDFSGIELTVVDEVGRDPVTIGEDYQFLTQLSNDVQYRAIAPICNADPITRCGKMALLQLLNKESKTESLENYIYQLLDKQIQLEPTNQYALFAKKIISFFTPYNSVIIGDENREIILSIFKEYLESDENAGNELVSWFVDWNLKENLLTQLLELFTQHFSDVTLLKRIVPLYDKSSQLFFEKEKNIEKLIDYKIVFADFLVKVGEREKAVKIYEEIYGNLPNETLADLLVPPTLDILKGEGGQLVKIALLEKMVEAKGEIEIADADMAFELACLQPLVKSRLETLVQVTNESTAQKVDVITQLLHSSQLAEKRTKELTIQYNPLPKELIDTHINHVQNTKTGLFSSMQELLATVNVPDQSVIKGYAEKVTGQKYKKLYELVSDITYALNIPSPEIYISRGENATQIKSFEGTPPFLLVGVDFIEEKSPNFLSQEELRFVLALEIAHLYFGHARITSNDVWRGAMDKGMFMVNTLLAFLPGITMLTSQFDKLKRVSSLLGRIQNISEKVSGFSDTYLKEMTFLSDDEQKEKELLAISRLMELLADRVGLLIANGDLHAVVRSMILASPKYATEMTTIERYGFKGMLAKKDADENFIYQDLIIRLHALCSFYLSTDYDVLNEKLIKE